MTTRTIRKQFGRRPSLASVLVWAIQQALKGYGIKHPDSKRQRGARASSRSMRAARKLKADR